MKFDITYWYGPHGKQWDYPGIIDTMAASGMTLACADEAIPERNKPLIKKLIEKGLRVNVIDRRIFGNVYNPDADMDKLVAEVTADYAEFGDSVVSYYVCDEPSSLRFPMLRRVTEAFEKHAPDKEAYINLFPNYASVKEQLFDENYQSHVENYMKTVKPTFLSYDHYHFCKADAKPDPKILEGLTDERERLIYLDSLKTFDRGGFFDNLEVIRNAAVRYSVPFMLIVLLIQHGGYRDLKRGEIAFEVYQAMAYGAKRMSYFTYCCPNDDNVWKWGDAIIDHDLNPSHHYEDVKEINKGLINIGRQLEATETEAVFHLDNWEKENVTHFAPYGGITEISGGKATLGFFKDGSLLVANKDFRNGAKLTLKTDKKLTPFDKYENRWLASGNTVTLDMAPGDGELLKIN